MGWLIALGALIGIAILPIGISAVYNADGAKVQALVGPVRFPLYPRKKKTKGNKKQNTAKETSSKKQNNGGSAKNFAPLLQRILDFLREAKGKFRVKHLQMHLTLGGSDPCDLAVNYGRAWAAVGNLIPVLEQHFIIKKREIDVRCDFTVEETRVFASLDLTITVARLLRLGVSHGIPVLREYLNIIKLRNGGAKV